MKKKILVALVVSIFLVGMVVAVAEEAGWLEKTPLQKLFNFLTVTGTKQSIIVVDEYGHGVSGAYVKVSWYGGSNYGYTNSNGAVQLDVNQMFAFNVYTQKSGYECVESTIYCQRCNYGTQCYKDNVNYHADASLLLGLKKVQTQPTPTPSPQICTAYEIECRNGNNLERCNYDGSKWNYYQSCSYGCNIGSHTCNPKPPVCTAYEKKCEGNSVYECYSDGLGWGFKESCSYGCSGGVCLPPTQICTPYDKRCSGDDLQMCSAEGNQWDFVEHCEFGCSDGQCLSDQTTPTPEICTAGDKRCSGDMLQQCDPGGDYWENIQDCTELGLICSGGQCKEGDTPTPDPVIPESCTPNEYECKDDDLYQCNEAGDKLEFVETCTYGCENGECKTSTYPPQPAGFELIFAIVGFLAVAYLIIRRRK